MSYANVILFKYLNAIFHFRNVLFHLKILCIFSSNKVQLFIIGLFLCQLRSIPQKTCKILTLKLDTPIVMKDETVANTK